MSSLVCSRTIRQSLNRVLAVSLATLMAACSASGMRAGEGTSREWYEQGLRQMERKRYSGAIEAFQEAATLYRDAALDADIQLALGDAYFHDKDYEAAIETYQEFLRLHPRNQHSSRAQYQIGMCYFKQMRGRDRSQEATVLALEAFEKVIRNYPRSELLGSAKEKMVFCRRRLAEHELYIGRYYFRTKDYAAALPRFDKVYHDYGDLGYGDDALYYLGLCYLRLEQKDEARKVWDRLIRDYPRSRYRKEIEDREG